MIFTTRVNSYIGTTIVVPDIRVNGTLFMHRCDVSSRRLHISYIMNSRSNRRAHRRRKVIKLVFARAHGFVQMLQTHTIALIAWVSENRILFLSNSLFSLEISRKGFDCHKYRRAHNVWSYF